MNRAIPALTCALALSGCVTTQPRGDPDVSVEQVLLAVKHDVDQYNSYVVASAKAPRQNDLCKSKVLLPISEVTITMTTGTKRTEGWTAGAEGSPTAFLKLSAGGGKSYTTENTQVLTFTVVPLPSPTTPAIESDKSPSALYVTLRDLRESMLRAGDKPPCFTFQEAKDQDNSIEFGFSATHDANVSTGINFFIFAIGATHAKERTAAHTIKVNFEGQGVFLTGM